MPLILEGDLDLLLRRRNNLILGRAGEARELGDGFLDDVQGLLDLVIGNHQGRRQTYDVLVGWLGLNKVSVWLTSRMSKVTYQQTLGLEQHAKVPRRVSVGLGLINNNGVEQTLAAHRLDDGTLNGLQTVAENVTELFGALNHVFLLDDLQRSDSDRAGQRVTTISRTVSARLDGEHNVLPTQDGGDGVHATGDSLAQQHHVGLDPAPLMAAQLASTGNTGLDLITDQQYVVLVAQGSGLLQVILVGNHDTCLALDGLHQERGQTRPRLLEGFPQCRLIVVCDRLIRSGNGAADTGQVRAIVLA